MASRIILTLVSLIFVLTSSHKVKLNNHSTSEVILPPLHQYPKFVIDLITLGNFNLYQDYLHLWLIQNLKTDNSKSKEQIIKIIDSTFKHRPHGEYLYLLAGLKMLKTFQSPLKSQEYFKMGFEIHHKSHILSFCLGFIYLHFIKNKQEAAKYLLKSYNANPLKPQYLKELVLKLQTNQTIYQSESIEIKKQFLEINSRSENQ